MYNPRRCDRINSRWINSRTSNPPLFISWSSLHWWEFSHESATYEISESNIGLPLCLCYSILLLYECSKNEFKATGNKCQECCCKVPRQKDTVFASIRELLPPAFEVSWCNGKHIYLHVWCFGFELQTTLQWYFVTTSCRVYLQFIHHLDNRKESASWGCHVEKRNIPILYFPGWWHCALWNKRDNLNLWRKLEDSLRKMEPAVAALLVWGDKQKCINAQNRFYKTKQKQKCSYNKTTEFLPVVGWDAAFSAFHYQSVNYILPYSSRFDAISWHYSQVYVNIKCEIMFRGQVLLYTDVCAVNPSHCPYLQLRTRTSK